MLQILDCCNKFSNFAALKMFCGKVGMSLGCTLVMHSDDRPATLHVSARPQHSGDAQWLGCKSWAGRTTQGDGQLMLTF